MEMTDAPTHATGRYGAVMVLKVPLIAPFVVPSRSAHAERHAWPGWLASAWAALPSGMAFSLLSLGGGLEVAGADNG